MNEPAPPQPGADPQQPLLDALAAVLQPLARLAVARGLTFAQIEEAMKQAVVDAALAAHPQQAAHRSASRVATATGLNRREATRLVAERTQRDAAAGAALPHGGRGRSRSLASELTAHWLAFEPYRDADGRPRPLPRQGAEPSFESLAQAVTRDVHPRSLLDELVRLGLVVLDEARDVVTLQRDSFVPQGDEARLLRWLGDNLGDHAAAAVDNVLADGRRHFEQAVYADGLAPESMDELKALIGAQWKLLVAALVPPLERMVEAGADAADGAPARRRVRVGLYAFDEPETGADGAAPNEPAAALPRRLDARRRRADDPEEPR